MWLSLNPEKWVAIDIMKVATPISYCYLANQFSMDRATVGKVIWDVYLDIQDILANCFIHLTVPSPAPGCKIVAAFPILSIYVINS